MLGTQRVNTAHFPNLRVSLLLAYLIHRRAPPLLLLFLLLLLLFLLLLFLLLQVFLGALTLRGAFSGYGQGSLPQQGVLLLRQLLLCLLGVGGGLPWQLPRLGKDLEAEPGGPSAGSRAQPCSPRPRRIYSCTSLCGHPAHTEL